MLPPKASDGEWGSVQEMDKYIVIVGDMIEILSNGTIKATQHRVVRTAWSRSSLIKFNGLDGDTVVQPLPQWVGGEYGAAKYAPIAQGAHIDAEMAQGEENLAEYSHPK